MTGDRPDRGVSTLSRDHHGRSRTDAPVAMLPDFAATVGALAETIVLRQRPSATEADAVAAFLLATHARMPDYLRTSLRIATLIFDAWPCLRHGRPFHRLPLAQRTAQLAAWEASRLNAARALMAFYGSFATFGLHTALHARD